jgi:hypothetical protein
LTDKDSLLFERKVVENIQLNAVQSNKDLDSMKDKKYLHFFRQQPYQDKEVTKKIISIVIAG